MPDLRLLDVLRTGGIEASIATTYSVYFPFYEEVVLRQLGQVVVLSRITFGETQSRFAAPPYYDRLHQQRRKSQENQRLLDHTI